MIRYFFLFLFFCGALTAQANTHTYRGDRLILQGLSFPTGSVFAIADPGEFELNQQFHSSTGRVVLKVDQYTGSDLNSYEGVDVTMTYDVTYYLASDPGVAQTLTDQTLELSFGELTQTDGTVHYMEGVTSMSLDITSVTTTGGVAIPVEVYAQLELEVTRYEVMDFSVVPTSLGHEYDAMNRELLVYWDRTELPWAESYDLEYTWVSDYGVAGVAVDKEEIDVNMRYDATRVNVKTDYYKIPLMYDRGYVVYRLRGRGMMKAGDGSWHAEEGRWSVENGAKKVDDFPHFHVDKAPDKHFQYAASFAEDGKRSDQVSYFDGTYRSRQQVSRNNETNQLIVGETIYDVEGRPAITVLPVPQAIPSDDPADKDFQSLPYQPNFTQDEEGDPYTFTHFDLSLPSACDLSAAPMGKTSGSSQYFSDANPDQEDHQGYVPDAQGYPYVQTVFTPDNTGRVQSQSMPGPDHQIGTGHEVKSAYTVPTQSELDMLFGTDVGYAQHYKKVYNKDQNGQWSAAYIDGRGQTIATSLVGGVPANSEGNPLFEGLLTTTELEALPDHVEVSLGCDGCEGKQVLQGSHLSYTQPLYVPLNDMDYTFSYDLSSEPFMPDAVLDIDASMRPVGSETSCASLCYNCVYTLDFRLLDECGAEVPLPGGSPSFPMAVGATDVAGSCTSSADFDITMTLDAGHYTLEKILTVDDAAVEAYVEDFIAGAASCLHTETSYEASYASINKDLYDENCASPQDFCMLCYESLSFFDDVNQNDQWNEGEAFFDIENSDNVIDGLARFEVIHEVTMTESVYRKLVEECNEVCVIEPVTRCSALLPMLEADVSPGGQYMSTSEEDDLWHLSFLNEGNRHYFNDGWDFWSDRFTYEDLEDAEQNTSTSDWYRDANGYLSFIPVEISSSVTELEVFGGALIEFDWRNPMHLQELESQMTLSEVTTPAIREVHVSGDMRLLYGRYDPSCDCYKVVNADDAETDAEVVMVTPDNLLYLEDVLDNWQTTWRDKLVTHHPEYGFYTACEAVSASSAHYDYQIAGTQTYAEATSDDLDFTITGSETTLAHVSDLLDDDPFFANDAPGAHRKDEMEEALMNYEGSGRTIKEMSAYTVGCANRYHDAMPASGTGCLDFGNTGISDEDRDAQWDFYKLNYLALKQDQVDKVLLGREHDGRLNSFRYWALRYRHRYKNAELRYVLTESMMEIAGLCGEDEMDVRAMQERVNMEHYLRTLQCPVDRDMEYFLKGMLASGQMNAGGATGSLLNQQTFTELLYDLAVDYQTDDPFIELTYTNTVTDNAGLQGYRMEVREGATVHEYVELLTEGNFTHTFFDGASQQTVNNIPLLGGTNLPSADASANYDVYLVDISNLLFTYHDGTDYHFTTNAVYDLYKPAIDDDHEDELMGRFQGVIKGFTSYRLNNCDYSQECVISEVGHDIEQLLNEALHVADYPDDLVTIDVTSTTEEELSATLSSMLRMYGSDCDADVTSFDLDVSTTSTELTIKLAPTTEISSPHLTVELETDAAFTWADVQGFSCMELDPTDPDHKFTIQVLSAEESGGEMHFTTTTMEGTVTPAGTGCQTGDYNYTFSLQSCGKATPDVCERQEVKNKEILHSTLNFLVNENDQPIGDLHDDANGHRNTTSNFLGEDVGVSSANLAGHAAFYEILAPELGSGHNYHWHNIAVSADALEYTAEICHLNGSGDCSPSQGTAAIKLVATAEDLPVGMTDLWQRIVNFGEVIPNLQSTAGITTRTFSTRARYYDANGDLQSVILSGESSFTLMNCPVTAQEELIVNGSFDYTPSEQSFISDCLDNEGNPKIFNIPGHAGPIFNTQNTNPYSDEGKWRGWCERTLGFIGYIGEPLSDSYISGCALIGTWDEVLAKNVSLVAGRTYRLQLSYEISRNTYFHHNDYDDDILGHPVELVPENAGNIRLRVYLSNDDAFNTHWNTAGNQSISQEDGDELIKGDAVTGWSTVSLLFTPDQDYEKVYFRAINSYEGTSVGGSPNFLIDDVSLVEVPTQPMNLPTETLELDPLEECNTSMQDLLSMNSELKYRQFIRDLRWEFRQAYKAHCLEHLSQSYSGSYPEQLSITYPDREYHYTLYYYDQSGKLRQTVPPEGVNQEMKQDKSLIVSQVTAARAAGTHFAPNHYMLTKYRYNSFGQLAAQYMPDYYLPDSETEAEVETRFWYDALGRMVASQNARQRVTQTTGDPWDEQERYSYTVYDELGRMIEAGETRGTIPNGITSPTTVRQVTHSFYEDRGFTVPGFTQQNLRNRIASIAYYEAPTGPVDATTPYDHAFLYTYDEIGNVEELVQDFPELDSYGAAARYKHIAYDYDLISGNVHEVTVQQGQVDEYRHRYTYDALNRLVKAQSSQRGQVWQTNAEYFYYDHGPLARVEYGDLKVQGQDYAYTIQGWLKGVNSTILDEGRDIGKDGYTLQHHHMGQDVFSYSLGYYGGDYKAINPLNQGAAGFTPTNEDVLTDDDLYNGNISHMTTSLSPLASPITATYRYDQLQRLRAANHLSDASLVSTNNWAAPVAETDYNTTYSYDANGNLEVLTRNAFDISGAGNLMDNLEYSYYDNPITDLPSNRLRAVKDLAPDQGFGGDLAQWQPEDDEDNYEYDAIGNLTKDKKEGIENITWNIQGKVAQVEKTDGEILNFYYDAMGNRIRKEQVTADGPVSTIYLRDASGNPMAVYKEDLTTAGSAAPLTLREWHLYGSDRLGMETTDEVVLNATASVDPVVTTTKGQKRYELKNHLGNVLSTVSDKREVSIPMTLMYNEEYSTTPSATWGAQNGSVTVTHNITEEAMEMVSTENGKGAIYVFPTVEGEVYTATATLSHDGTSDMYFEAWDQTAGELIAQSKSKGDGTFTVTFRATSDLSRLKVAKIMATGASDATVYIHDMTITTQGEYAAVVTSYSNYYPFGWEMPGGFVSTEVIAEEATFESGTLEGWVEGNDMSATVVDVTGGKALRLEASDDAKIYKDIPTESGETYTFSFDVLDFPEGEKINVRIENGGNPILNVNHTEPVSSIALTFDGTGGEVRCIIGINEESVAIVDNITLSSEGEEELVGLSYPGEGYRFGFNGKEKDDEWSTGAKYDYGFRIYDPRVAKFLSVDPLASSYPWYTPYQFAGNKPIAAIDLDGLEEAIVVKLNNADGTTQIQIYDRNEIKRDLTWHVFMCENNMKNLSLLDPSLVFEFVIDVDEDGVQTLRGASTYKSVTIVGERILPFKYRLRKFGRKMDTYAEPIAMAIARAHPVILAYSAISGEDPLNGRQLSDQERAYKGVMAVVSVVGTPGAILAKYGVRFGASLLASYVKKATPEMIKETLGNMMADLEKISIDTYLDVTVNKDLTHEDRVVLAEKRLKDFAEKYDSEIELIKKTSKNYKKIVRIYEKIKKNITYNLPSVDNMPKTKN